MSIDYLVLVYGYKDQFFMPDAKRSYQNNMWR
jgi:hypothetical protein